MSQVGCPGYTLGDLEKKPGRVSRPFSSDTIGDLGQKIGEEKKKGRRREEEGKKEAPVTTSMLRVEIIPRKSSLRATFQFPRSYFHEAKLSNLGHAFCQKKEPESKLTFAGTHCRNSDS